MEESLGVVDNVRRRVRCPVVVRLHGPWFLNGPALGVTQDKRFASRVAYEGKAIRNATAITSPSKDLIARVEAFYERKLSDAVIIPNAGPDVPEGEQWDSQTCEADTILFVGRFDRHKGGDVMIDAFREVAAAHPTARLLFAGPDGNLTGRNGRSFGIREYVADRMDDHGMRERIQILGQQTPSQISNLRRRAAMTIVASRYETFGMTVVEALAAGAPLVAADAGAISEIVVDGKTGLLFKTGDASALAAQIKRLLNDPTLARSLAMNGRADFVSRFSQTAVGRRMLDFYESVVAQHRRR
jgi:glycosyltransferase involved in cell wall biosynthesis